MRDPREWDVMPASPGGKGKEAPTEHPLCSGPCVACPASFSPSLSSGIKNVMESRAVPAHLLCNFRQVS